MAKPSTPKPIGGGWYLLDDGRKIQGRAAAYEAAGLDPDTDGNRRSDAAKQRHRGSVVEERRRRVAQLMLTKAPMRKMAQALGVSLKTIHTDVTAIRQEWREQRRTEVDDYVLTELASLEEDEYRLRLRYQSAQDDDTKNRIYDRILRVMTRRWGLLGLEPPDVRRVAITIDADIHTHSDVVLRAGGAEADYIRTLEQAQGLRAV